MHVPSVDSEPPGVASTCPALPPSTTPSPGPSSANGQSACQCRQAPLPRRRPAGRSSNPLTPANPCECVFGARVSVAGGPDHVIAVCLLHVGVTPFADTACGCSGSTNGGGGTMGSQGFPTAWFRPSSSGHAWRAHAPEPGTSTDLAWDVRRYDGRLGVELEAFQVQGSSHVPAGGALAHQWRCAGAALLRCCLPASQTPPQGSSPLLSPPPAQRNPAQRVEVAGTLAPRQKHGLLEPAAGAAAGGRRGMQHHLRDRLAALEPSPTTHEHGVGGLHCIALHGTNRGRPACTADSSWNMEWNRPSPSGRLRLGWPGGRCVAEPRGAVLSVFASKSPLHPSTAPPIVDRNRDDALHGNGTATSHRPPPQRTARWQPLRSTCSTAWSGHGSLPATTTGPLTQPWWWYMQSSAGLAAAAAGVGAGLAGWLASHRHAMSWMVVLRRLLHHLQGRPPTTTPSDAHWNGPSWGPRVTCPSHARKAHLVLVHRPSAIHALPAMSTVDPSSPIPAPFPPTRGTERGRQRCGYPPLPPSPLHFFDAAAPRGPSVPSGWAWLRTQARVARQGAGTPRRPAENFPMRRPPRLAP
ncbi:hypothetical protein Purlil1_328 [Purpureocillium lilacinum]|uniref:Uncharacterized protein n=1 Tax=Purpureocillium lilacinum TaxID=33203 RepID=A0ABR0CHD7_PURLI|nr:hypothetical protein Purlil1_328 [Purpureocillium lilacinum]